MQGHHNLARGVVRASHRAREAGEGGGAAQERKGLGEQQSGKSLKVYEPTSCPAVKPGELTLTEAAARCVQGPRELRGGV